MNYNIGDIVEITDCRYHHGFKIGEEVTITSVNHEDLDYSASNGAKEFLITESEFKPANPA